jgi:hypothetical protein
MDIHLDTDGSIPVEEFLQATKSILPLFGKNSRVKVMVFNATFNNITVISWQSDGGNHKNKPQTFFKSLMNFIT